MSTAIAGPDESALSIEGVGIATDAVAPEGSPLQHLYSGWRFRASETQALQTDDFENPAFVAVDTGEDLWNTVDGTAGKSCADCHNKLQHLTGSDRWQVGDMMGAQLVEQNIRPQLDNAKFNALTQCILIFAAVFAGWFCMLYLSKHFRLTRKLQLLATTDPLTGCINRREV